jgi:hypothetical protein
MILRRGPLAGAGAAQETRTLLEPAGGSSRVAQLLWRFLTVFAARPSRGVTDLRCGVRDADRNTQTGRRVVVGETFV